MLAEDGLHILLTTPDRAEHRLWLPGPEPPALGTPLISVVDLDAYAVERAAAVLRFWHAAAPPARIRTPPPRAGPIDHRLIRRMRMLQAYDARRDGATYRDIAAALFGDADVAGAAPWKTSSLRETVISLVEGSTRLVMGGWRDLLRPKKRRRK